MGLKVVGAGLGRTGTNSLKLALEHLLREPCYHMWEVFSHLEHAPVWAAAAEGDIPDWDQLLDGFGAAIDFPSAAFWPELMVAYPESLVILSVRDTDAWWKSCQRTIFSADRSLAPTEINEMVDILWAARFTSDVQNEASAKDAYETFNDRVRREVPRERLLEWRPDQGWAPICAALGVSVPEIPFPHVNTTSDFLRKRGTTP